ncbi:glycoside hydrolase family 3 protein [Microbacterium fluvii]
MHSSAAPSLPAALGPSPTPDPIAGLSLEQKVGQLFMVGTPVDRAAKRTLAAVQKRHVGGVFLHGRSDAGVTAIAKVTARFERAAAKAAVPLWIATDQEGGAVQVLQGRGFDRIPAAREQGDADAVRADAARWGAQLRKAGVTMNLAPVADIVTSPEEARRNAPIGELWREYGYDRETVAARAGAFAEGMREAGVVPTFKHFPGLGRVEGNTDYSADVIDTRVGPRSPDVQVYRELTASGPSVVMVGTAAYEKLDPGVPAAFSHAIVTDLLRDEIGFDGVVITDDLSATAQVRSIDPAKRAVRAVAAGVDIVLVSADPKLLPEMYDAVVTKAEDDPGFADKVDDAARRVLRAKQTPLP